MFDFATITKIVHYGNTGLILYVLFGVRDTRQGVRDFGERLRNLERRVDNTLRAILTGIRK